MRKIIFLMLALTNALLVNAILHTNGVTLVVCSCILSPIQTQVVKKNIISDDIQTITLSKTIWQEDFNKEENANSFKKANHNGSETWPYANEWYNG